MKISAAQKRKRARIEVIPLIDIMFFLLATFVLVSVSMTENRGLIVALPESKTNESKDAHTPEDSKPLQITVSILQDGTFALDKNEMNWEDLESQLRTLVENNQNRKLLTLMGDKSSNLQNTIQVLDLARELKIDSVTIRTKTP
jgi:biopolymer transport protein ExbD